MEHGGWGPIEWITLAYVIITALGVAVILAGALFARWQLKGLKEQTGLSALTQISEEFQSEKLANDRRNIYQNMSNSLDLTNIPKDLYMSCYRVMVSLNRIGFLVHQGVVPMDQALAEYIGPPSIRMWGKLKKLVESDRLRRGEKTYMNFFQNLACKSQKKLPNYKLTYFEESKQDG